MADTIPAGQPAALPDQDDAPTIIEARSSGGYTDDLTPEELAYFNSRGADTSGLGVEPNLPASNGGYSEPTPAPAPAAPAPQAAPAPAPRAPLTPDGAPIVADAAPLAADPNMVGENEDVDFDTLTVDHAGVMRDPKGRFVPHAALHRAREQFKQARSEANERLSENARLKEQMATLAGRFEQLNALMARPAEAAPPAAAPAPPVEEPMPDIQTNIFGWAEWAKQEIIRQGEETKALREQATQGVEQVRGELTEVNMMTGYKQDAASFVREQPSFGDAYRHLITGRAQELALLGYNEQQRMEVITKEERELVQAAYKQGRRPAEFIFQVSQARGFRPPAAAPAPTPALAAPAPAATPAPAAPAPTMVPAPAAPAQNATPAAIAQHMANLAAARAASPTLSGAGGVSGDGVTPESIANMSEAEFSAFYERVGGKKGMRQFMGA